MKNYKLTEGNAYTRLLGRSRYVEDGVALELTADGIEFCAFIENELKFTVKSDGDSYFTLFVDGKRYAERLGAPKGDTELVATLEKGKHTVRIVKQSEYQWVRCVLTSLTFSGEFCEKPNEREKYVEFIGDSITCGYGNLIHGMPEDGSDAGAPKFCDGTRTYAYLASEAAGVDISVIGYSGIGLIHGWSQMPMKEFYTAKHYIIDNGAQKFDFASARRPDLVVVNLGTNDMSFGVTLDEFSQGVRELVGIIREGYGEDTRILWIYGMMGHALCAATLPTLASLGGEANGLYTLELPEDHNGGNGHPSGEAHEMCSSLLAPKLCELLKKQCKPF